MTVSKPVLSVREIEKRVIRALLRPILQDGCKVSVYDGGEWVVVKSMSMKKIMAALFSVDVDMLLVRDKDGKRIGTVTLVYGNGGWDVIADNSISLEVYISLANKIADRYPG